MNAFNTLLNRYSMYKVISGALTILYAIALTLSFLGALAYSPLAMLASVTVIGFSVLLTSMLFGLIFGVRVHAESSFITAVILFFIFTPTMTLTGLAALVVVGMIAGASKFILAYKGRHLFNPAAIAAVTAGLIGIAHASWWVGTPVLIVPTFLLGFAILLKTRRVPVSGTFLVLATVLVIGDLLLQGESLGGSLILWLSWPVLFFASFMLTEPLTLPGKRWQQIFEGVIVALLFAIPISIGNFSTSPALALVVGNLISFGFTRRQKLSLIFKEKKQLTPTSYEFIFTPRVPVRYTAGQFIEIRVPHKKGDFRGSRRSFSVTSAPGDTTIRLGVKFYEPSSSFKKALRGLTSGAVVESTGVSGDFTLPKDTKKPLLFVAGGIGITPFISHLRSLKNRKETRDIILFYVIRNIDELAYTEMLEASGIQVYIVTASSQRLALPKKWMHINEATITKEIFAEYVSDISSRTAYISGPPSLVDDVKKRLSQLHVKHIKTDYFIGY